jgi:hypothetical protein
MRSLLAIILLTSSLSYAQQASAPTASAPTASAPVGKPCSEMTKDATRIERSRCVPDTKCSNLSKDATRIEIARCEKSKK